MSEADEPDRCEQCKQAFTHVPYKVNMALSDGVSLAVFCTQFCSERYVAGLVTHNPREYAAVDPRKPPGPRKVSEVVAELAGLWGLDSDDAAAVICALADKIRAQWVAPAIGPDSPLRRHARPVGCKRCGEPLAYPGALFCGAACSAMWESGDRDPTPSAGPESRSKPVEPE